MESNLKKWQELIRTETVDDAMAEMAKDWAEDIKALSQEVHALTIQLIRTIRIDGVYMQNQYNRLAEIHKHIETLDNLYPDHPTIQKVLELTGGE